MSLASYLPSSTPRTSVPVVDIGGLRSPDPAAWGPVVSAIRDACLDKGFFYCVGHGVDPVTIERLFSVSRAFFALSEAEKRKVSLMRSKANRGYEALGAQTLEPGTPPDRKEGYYIGLDVAADSDLAERFFNTGPNVWPEAMPEFRLAISDYFDRLCALASLILEGLALSLDLERRFFEAFEQQPIATLRLLHYPPQPANPCPGEKGCGAHTDFGGITILLQDDIGGLQVWDRDAEQWLDAAPMPGAFVINLGDMMSRWTNDRYRSTVHRVVNTSGQERYSAPFFFSGNPEHLIECIPSCLSGDEGPKYAAITVDAHMRERYAATYG